MEIASDLLLQLEDRAAATADKKARGKKKSRNTPAEDGDEDTWREPTLARSLMEATAKANPSSTAAAASRVHTNVVTDETLIWFAGMIGITITRDHLDKALLTNSNVSEAQMVNLRSRIKNALDAVRNTCSKTKQAYMGKIAEFLIWLHLAHPECFRRTPEDACLPMLSLPYVMEYFNNLSCQRLNAVRLKRILQEIADKMGPARMRLAPGGLSLNGLAKMASITASELRNRWADAILAFVPPTALPSLQRLPASDQAIACIKRGNVWKVFECLSSLTLGAAPKDKVTVECKNLPFIVDTRDGTGSFNCAASTTVECMLSPPCMWGPPRVHA
eukprot:jgi/Ulvmu1/9956/UM059_0004.1